MTAIGKLGRYGYRIGRPAGVRFVPSSDDIMLCSYPRSGNTWLRFMIANLTNPGIGVSFSNIEKRVPDIYVSSTRSINSVSSPRFIKSHQPFNGAYRKVVYLVRHPVATAVSYRRFLRKGGNVQGEVAPQIFLRSFFDGPGPIQEFGSWTDNVTSWLHAPENSALLLIRYEDLRQAPDKQLRRLVDFCGLHASSREIDRAIVRSSPAEMRKLETEIGGTWGNHKALGQAIDMRSAPDHTEFDMRDMKQELAREPVARLMRSLNYQ